MSSIPYESTEKRLGRNIQDTKAALKKEYIPPELRSKLINDVDALEREFNKYTKTFGRRVVRVSRFLSDLSMDIVVSPILILKGTAAHDYKVILEDMDTLLGDESFTYAARIKDMFDRS